MYPVIGEPPSLTGTVQRTTARPLPLVAIGDRGALGTVDAGCESEGMNEFEVADGAPVPIALVAVTAHVYVAPFVRPVTTMGVPLLDAVPVAPPLFDTQVAV